MSLPLVVTIPGNPIPKGRPQFGKGRTYTPKATEAAEEALRWALKGEMLLQGVQLDSDSPFGVHLVFYRGDRKRADLDNLVKLVFDAANGIVWGDDAQVVELYATVVRGDPLPRTTARFYPGPDGWPLVASHDHPLTESD